MPGTLPAGPYRSVTLPNGDSVPFYVIPFDARGVCEAPQTRADLVRQVAENHYTDVFLFSHGWNNDWTVATKRYDDFLAGFMKMRQELNLATPGARYRPLLVGVFWPSTALTFGASEEGPAMAGVDDEAVARERHDLAELGGTLPPDEAVRFFDLVQRDSVTEREARELVGMFAGLRGAQSDDIPGALLTTEELLDGWITTAADEALDDFGTATTTGVSGAQVAGVLDLVKKLDPRQIVRTFTVWQMKDRAGAVGARGVGPLLRDLLDSTARVHLVGHSFGAKVVMSALCAAPLSRNVSSALLLQPAMSHLCFAGVVPGTLLPGGYRPALDRVDGRILTTFSSHDWPLTTIFHLALRRAKDLGEPQIAAAEPPSPYAALGGFGPRRSGELILDIQDPPQPYTWPANTKLIALRGDRTISGHGDISNRSTWWALYCAAFQP